jgi:hypothetical protein
MATKLHDGDLFFYFAFLTAEVIGDGQMRPRARDAFSLELVETVGAGIVARHNLDERMRRTQTSTSVSARV